MFKSPAQPRAGLMLLAGPQIWAAVQGLMAVISEVGCTPAGVHSERFRMFVHVL